MKIERRPLRTQLAAALLALPFAGAVASAVAYPPAAPFQDKMDEFRREWAQASKINAKEEMQKLVRQYNEQAILRVIALLEQVSAQQGNDALYKELNELRAAWQTTVKSGFVDQVEKYFSLLHPSARNERSTYVRVYQLASRELADAKAVRDVAKIRSMSGRFEELARQFESVGDYYYAGQCWANAVAANHPDNIGVDVDYGKLADLLGEFIRTRDQIDLKDVLYGQNKASYGQLSAQGFGTNAAAVAATLPAGEGDAAGAEGNIIPRGTLPTGKPVEAALSFEVVDELGAFERPNYNCDDVYQIWMALDLRQKGTTAEFMRVTDGPRVHRTGSREIEIDTDFDGTPDLQIPITGNLQLMEFKVGKGDDARPWAVLTTVGNQDDFYQGIQCNLAPNDDAVAVYYTSASSVVGEIAGTPVRIFDEDLDGIYGSKTKTWAWMGLTPENFQPEMDSILIGQKGKRAQPWSEFVQLDGTWYKLKPAKFGQVFEAEPYDLPAGRLKLSFKGPKLSWLVLRGTGRYANTLFDLVGPGSKGIEVPAGKYQLYYGEVRKGSKRQVAKTLVLPGKETPLWEVKEGETVTVTLGKPFGFDFDVVQSDSEVTVLGSTVTVTGVAGERYERPWNCVARPEMSIRKAGTKKGTKPKKMDAVVGQDQLYAPGGWIAAWSPIDTTLKKPGGADVVEVQLTEKKNKLFGKVVSDWKK